MIQYIPTGTKNLKLLYPSVNWPDTVEYFVEILDTTGNILGTTNKYAVDSCEDILRIHFINYLGLVDVVNLKKQAQIHESKSELFQKTLTNTRAEHAISKASGRANDSFVGVIEVDENNLDYFDELLDSPMAWLEWKGVQGQPDDYLPIVIADSKTVKYKTEDRYSYEIEIEFKYSKEKILIKN